MPFAFRCAHEQDLDSILRLYDQLHPSDPQLGNQQAMATYRAVLDSPHLDIFVLEDGGGIVATSYLNVIPNLTRGASPYAVIENVVVDAGRRGHGLGRQLMAGTLAAAWEAGCYKAMLLTGSQKPATHAFYERCGFSPDAKTAYLARPR